MDRLPNHWTEGQEDSKVDMTCCLFTLYEVPASMHTGGTQLSLVSLLYALKTSNTGLSIQASLRKVMLSGSKPCYQYHWVTWKIRIM